MIKIRCLADNRVRVWPILGEIDPTLVLILDRVFLQLAVERSLTDPQEASCHQLVSIELLDRTEDGPLLQFSDGNDFRFAVAVGSERASDSSQ